MKQQLVLLLLLCVLVVIGVCDEKVEYYTDLPPLFEDSNNRDRATSLNTDYLGAGYNVLKGNPWQLDPNVGRDPGWITNRIISYSYTEGLTSSDGRYNIPNGASIQSVSSCQYGASSTQIFGAHSYYNYLSTYASVSGSSVGGSFSLSLGYQQTAAGTSTNLNVLVTSAASCVSYVAALYPFSTYSYTLTPAFINATTSLPATYNSANPQQFLDYFNTWGTHVSQQIYMGGRASSTYTFNSASYNELQSSQIDFSAAASASWGYYSGDASASATYSQASTTYFNSKASSILRTFQGPPPPIQPSNINTWLNNVINTPFVLSYSLTPISSLVQTISASRATAISNALQDYCSKTSGCVPINSVPPDPTHTPTVAGCRLCSSCGGNYPLAVGQRLNQGDWGVWRAYESGCTGAYRNTWDQVQMCCGSSPVDNTGMCRMCQSCGGSWTQDLGARLTAGDWGGFNTFATGCTEPYTSTFSEFHFCCKSQQQCKLCKSCGGGLVEVGREVHSGDWGPWNTYDYGCAGGLSGTWEEAVLCCLPSV